MVSVFLHRKAQFIKHSAFLEKLVLYIYTLLLLILNTYVTIKEK